MSRRFLLQPVICAQSAVDLEIWADFARFEWFCKRKGNSMTEIWVYVFGKGFPQATASLATCYNAVEGSYPPKSNHKVRKLDWHSIYVRRPSIGVQPSNNVRTSNGGQPWPGKFRLQNSSHYGLTVLTHWGRATHICVGKLTIIGSDNGLSPGRRQAIIWTIAGILLIGPSGTNFSEILIGIQTFSFKKMHLKMSYANWRPFVSASMC